MFVRSTNYNDDFIVDIAKQFLCKTISNYVMTVNYIDNRMYFMHLLKLKPSSLLEARINLIFNYYADVCVMKREQKRKIYKSCNIELKTRSTKTANVESVAVS